MERYIVLEKAVGETPLESQERYRAKHPKLADTPMAYAGRLDPMASGKLLVLIGDECKRQERYFGLDKEYRFEVLLGPSTDTGDVLGLVESTTSSRPNLEINDIQKVCDKLVGKVELPYPHYSSKTVNGKPLHTWAVEGRLDEIEIPTKVSTIYKLTPEDIRTETKDTIYKYITEKIETIPAVTDPRKALGNDFRRPEIRNTWKVWHEDSTLPDQYQVTTLRCIASSGTYMRTLAGEIGKALGTEGLAYSIHRTKIGNYQKMPLIGGVWLQQF